MTHLRKMMLEELQRRNYSESLSRVTFTTVEQFAKHFHRSPDQLGPEHIRDYQVHLFRVQKLTPSSVPAWPRCASCSWTLKRALDRGRHALSQERSACPLC